MTDPLLAQLQSSLGDAYTLEREVGRGGMATVYLAHDHKHDRAVALKVLNPDLSHTLGADRFVREIRTAARLQHPHILSVFDSGASGTQLWFTMPYVEGETLRDRLARTRQLPVDDALRIAKEAARGLAYAHLHGVIHRDVKPENLMLTHDGSTLVADFGIARATDMMSGDMTGTGITLGTPAYMSPEQASGERTIDARSDVYALAAVLYEMLAGEPAFSGLNAQAVIARVLTQDPRPIHPMRPAVTPTLDAVIARAMARTAVDRYPTMEAFVAALDAAVTGEQFGEAHVKAWRRPIVVGAVATLAVLLLLATLRRTPATVNERDTAPLPGRTVAIAVLPFENRGRREDAYIADGIADEIRGKLAAIPGLTIIARVSSNEYRSTQKRPQQIASELGVNYLLGGTVQFEAAAAGRSARLRVSPELVQVANGTTPSTRWQQPFDADLADIFKVQSDIASRVASALDIALNATQQGQLADRPTENLQAYDAYLRGEEISHAVNSNEHDVLARALVEYNRAVELDPRFVAAWARISRAHSLMFYWASSSLEDDTLSRRAAERAIALAPGRWEGHWAMGLYLASVAHDPLRAIAEEQIALRLAPRSAEVLTALSNAQSFAGQWSASSESAVQARALDPRSVDALRREGFARMGERRYHEALAVLERAVQLDPLDPNTHYRLFAVRLATGDRAGALAALSIPGDSVAQAVSFATGAAYLVLAFDRPLLEAVVRMSVRSFGGSKAFFAVVRARAYTALGDETRARAYAESVLVLPYTAIDRRPNQVRDRRARVWALAKLGRKTEAIAAAEEAMRSLPIERDWIDGAMNAYVAAQAFAMVGERERAVDVVEALLGRKTFVQPGWIRLDPAFAVLRGDVRFQRLVAAPAVQ